MYALAAVRQRRLTFIGHIPWARHVIAAFALVALAGCGDRAEDSRQQMHKLQMVMIEIQMNGGDWPDSLDSIKDKFGGEAAWSKLMTNPLTGDHPGYEYVKPEKKSDGSKNDSQQVILYQLRGGKRDTTLKVGYADGSVRLLGTK